MIRFKSIPFQLKPYEFHHLLTCTLRYESNVIFSVSISKLHLELLFCYYLYSPVECCVFFLPMKCILAAVLIFLWWGTALNNSLTIYYKFIFMNRNNNTFIQNSKQLHQIKIEKSWNELDVCLLFISYVSSRAWKILSWKWLSKSLKMKGTQIGWKSVHEFRRVELFQKKVNISWRQRLHPREFFVQSDNSGDMRQNLPFGISEKKSTSVQIPIPKSDWDKKLRSLSREIQKSESHENTDAVFGCNYVPSYLFTSNYSSFVIQVQYKYHVLQFSYALHSSAVVNSVFIRLFCSAVQSEE